MSIIQPNQTVPDQSKRLTDYVTYCKQQDNTLFQVFLAGLITSFQQKYQAETGFTAQEIFDEYQRQGAGDPALLCQIAQKAEEMLLLADPNTPMPQPPFPITINPDGSVTTPVV